MDMTIDIVLIVLGAICLFVGLIGCIVPMLPGPPVSYVGLLLIHFSNRAQFSMAELIWGAVAVVVVVLLDYFTPMIGTKKFGGTKYGNWGCIIGTFVGLFFTPAGGIIWGPFVGAVVGELLADRPFPEALKAGFGAFLGFLFGTLLKLLVSGYFIFRAIAVFF